MQCKDTGIRGMQKYFWNWTLPTITTFTLLNLSGLMLCSGRVVFALLGLAIVPMEGWKMWTEESYKIYSSIG